TDPLCGVVIAIFAEHSTCPESSTIIPMSNDRAQSWHARQEIVMKRREFLKFSFGTVAAAALSQPASAEASPKEIRIGYQKNGVLVIARQQAPLEEHFAPQGIVVKWLEFSSGPPMMEAMNVGSLDYG